ncbi:MAG: hypothetical protein ABIK65_06115 [Candidatus Eisenbacteria bacterium]
MGRASVWLLLTILIAGSTGLIASPVPDSRVHAAEGAVVLLEGEGVDEGLRRVFLDVERAWRIGGADSLVRHIGERGALLPRSGEERSERFSRSQALYILDGMMQGSETISFEFLRFRNLDGANGRPNGAAVREALLPGGAVRRDLVFVALARQDDRWTIDEIRTKRP